MRIVSACAVLALLASAAIVARCLSGALALSSVSSLNGNEGNIGHAVDASVVLVPGGLYKNSSVPFYPASESVALIDGGGVLKGAALAAFGEYSWVGLNAEGRYTLAISDPRFDIPSVPVEFGRRTKVAMLGSGALRVDCGVAIDGAVLYCRARPNGNWTEISRPNGAELIVRGLLPGDYGLLLRSADGGVACDVSEVLAGETRAVEMTGNASCNVRIALCDGMDDSQFDFAMIRAREELDINEVYRRVAFMSDVEASFRDAQGASVIVVPAPAKYYAVGVQSGRVTTRPISVEAIPASSLSVEVCPIQMGRVLGYLDLKKANGVYSVVASPSGSDVLRSQWMRTLRVSEVNNGHWELSEVEPGAVDLYLAFSPGMISDASIGLTAVSLMSMGSVEVSGGDSAVLDMKGTDRIALDLTVLVNGIAGESGMMIEVYSNGQLKALPVCSETDSSGRARVMLFPGNYRIRVISPRGGWCADSGLVVAEDSGLQSHVIECVTIRGRIALVDQGGRPLAGKRVQLYADNADGGRSVLVSRAADAVGEVEVDLVQGIYWVRDELSVLEDRGSRFVWNGADVQIAFFTAR